jgi:hypothetical protein
MSRHGFQDGQQVELEVDSIVKQYTHLHQQDKFGDGAYYSQVPDKEIEMAFNVLMSQKSYQTLGNAIWEIHDKNRDFFVKLKERISVQLETFVDGETKQCLLMVPVDVVEGLSDDYILSQPSDSVFPIAYSLLLSNFNGNDSFQHRLLTFAACLGAFLVGGIQLTLLSFLWSSLPDFSNVSGLCATNPFFVLCLFAAFLIENGVTGERYPYGTVMCIPRDHHFHLVQRSDQAPLFLHIVRYFFRAMSSVVTFFTVIVSARYVLYESGIGNMLQAVVAILFIADLDNVAVKMFYIRYPVEKIYGLSVKERDTSKTMKENLLWVFYMIGLIVVFPIVILYSLNTSFC